MADTTTSSTSSNRSSQPGGATSAQVRADLQDQRRHAEQRMRPNVETERAQAQQNAENNLDAEAIAALQQTERALNAISEGRTDEALAAIEQATGKINVLLSRNPATALIPVDVTIAIIDTAPDDVDEITALEDAAEIALDINDLPTARNLLDALRSEIRTRIYNLPLATYPSALQEAARLIDQKKSREAGAVLLTALNTLAVVDQVTPIPLLLVREAINQAQERAEKEKDAAQALFDTARDELHRAMQLGYTPDDAEYKAIRDQINDLRKQLKGKDDTGGLFSKLKERLASLMRRQSDRQVSSDLQKQQPPKAA
jgi:hypothetical protein